MLGGIEMDASGDDPSDMPLSQDERADGAPPQPVPGDGDRPVSAATLPHTPDEAPETLPSAQADEVTAPPPPALPPTPPDGAQAGTEAGELPEAPPKKRRTVLWISIAAAVVVLIVVGVVAVVALSGGTSIAMPATIAGESKLQSSGAQVLANGMSETMKKQTGAETLAGIYGTEAQPKFLVIAVNAAPPSGDPLVEMGPGIQQSLGTSATIDTSSITRRTVGSTSYECAPVSVSTTNGSSLDLSLCTWEDGSTFGLIITLDPSVDGMDVVTKAHDAVVS